ncbi:FecR family protein [Olivibacter domesticus]|uniref:FecR family protein n=1 Tax=Olivibacter domesticus TaxID=407022 RepID=A0A1H7IGG4_OLID1|nr:FecR domain-containing protein [Olivibacter domesticus]SEK61414.1 FecR family protein [Olivibacter domesticus]
MEPDYDINELLFRKLAGNLNPDELEYIDKQLSERQEVRNQLEELESKLQQQGVVFSQLAEDPNWTALPDLILDSQRRRWPRIIGYAAMIAAIIGGIFVAVYQINRKENVINPLAGAQEKEVELRLAGGGVVPLGRHPDTITAGNALLGNANNTLSYIEQVQEGDSALSGSLNTLTVPAGKYFKVLLADGTEIWLNSVTSLQFPFTFNGPTREISIRGEAYLKIAQNTQKPFIVHLLPAITDNDLEKGTIQVLGTEFNVNSYEGSTLKVALSDGAVNFKVAGDQVLLKPGRQATYSVGQGMVVGKYDQEEVTSWIKGQYYMTDVTLEDLATKFPRWTGHAVKFDSDHLRGKLFSGVYNRNRPLKAFLENMKETMGINYYFSPDSTLHFR